MAIQVLMPKIGLTMAEGKIVEWKKKEGDWVEKGEILFLFETEKVTIEVEAPDSGVLAKILVKAEETVPVATVVALLLPKGAELVEVPAPKEEISRAREEARPGEFRPSPAGRVRATPLAKKMVRQKGMDWKQIPGSGEGGRIRKIDVERALLLPPPSQAPKPEAVQPGEKGKLVKITGMRKVIAQKMLASKVETAQIYMSNTIDATRILEYREKSLAMVEKKAGVRLTITDILMKITAAAISLHPVMNTRWTPEGILWFDDIHMGMAMALEEGLIVPVIWDIGKKSLAEIAGARAELVEKGRSGKLIPDDMKGSTFTFSSLGMYGIEEFCPIINQPESAILGVGAILDQPAVMNKALVVRPMMKVTLSYDHRVIDGARAAEFMRTSKDCMEDPVLILA